MLPLTAQQTPRPPLRFDRFEVGQSLASLAALARERHGSLLCKTSRTDPALRECRAELSDSSGWSQQVWLSAVDSNASITTIASQLSTADLLRWQGQLAAAYGRPRERIRGRQRSLQWIRDNTMMRLTWRPEGGGVAASVSLIDGTRLDAWGRRIEARLNPRPPADSVRRDSTPAAAP